MCLGLGTYFFLTTFNELYLMFIIIKIYLKLFYNVFSQISSGYLNSIDAYASFMYFVFLILVFCDAYERCELFLWQWTFPNCYHKKPQMSACALCGRFSACCLFTFYRQCLERWINNVLLAAKRCNFVCVVKSSICDD